MRLSIATNLPHDKTNKMACVSSMTQIRLGNCPIWLESSLSAWRKLGSLPIHWVHSEDSDQTGQMPRLIWVFAGRTVILLVLSWGGSVYEGIPLEMQIPWKSWVFRHPKICCNYSRIWNMWSYGRVRSPKDLRCRWNGKQCRPWSDCSLTDLGLHVCLNLSVRKLRNITVFKFDSYVCHWFHKSNAKFNKNEDLLLLWWEWLKTAS